MMNMEVRNLIRQDAIENYRYDLKEDGTYGMEVDFILADYIRNAIDFYELDGDDPEDIEDAVYDEIYDEAESLYQEAIEIQKEWVA